jgi:hypothetical protein
MCARSRSYKKWTPTTNEKWQMENGKWQMVNRS